jgi:hypothetical protein
MLPGMMRATFFAGGGATVVVVVGPGLGIMEYAPMPRAAMMIMTIIAMDCIRVIALLDNISFFPFLRVQDFASPYVFNSLCPKTRIKFIPRL